MNKRQNTTIYPGSPYVDSTQINIRLHPALTITQSTNYHSFKLLNKNKLTNNLPNLGKPIKTHLPDDLQEDSHTATCGLEQDDEQDVYSQEFPQRYQSSLKMLSILLSMC